MTSVPSLNEWFEGPRCDRSWRWNVSGGGRLESRSTGSCRPVVFLRSRRRAGTRRGVPANPVICVQRETVIHPRLRLRLRPGPARGPVPRFAADVARRASATLSGCSLVGRPLGDAGGEGCSPPGSGFPPCSPAPPCSVRREGRTVPSLLLERDLVPPPTTWLTEKVLSGAAFVQVGKRLPEACRFLVFCHPLPVWSSAQTLCSLRARVSVEGRLERAGAAGLWCASRLPETPKKPSSWC